MPLDVTCASCKTRFQVSEKFAGKKGPCPKCKAIIQIPTLKEQLKIEEPEASVPKDSSGRPVFKPIGRTETRLPREQAIAIGGVVFVIVLGALILRFASLSASSATLIAAVGAILLAPALALAGYAFLRDDELDPYRGPQLWMRIAACGIVYPALWGVYWLIFAYLDVLPQDGFYLAAVIPVVIAFGTVTAMAAFDFDFGPAAFHYCVYLVATIALRMLMGMNALWNT